MKQELGWWFPDKEQHLLEWMSYPTNQVPLNGRHSYQGKKQIAAMELCKNFRTAIDVGAHIGLWSYNLMHKFELVHAFEPVAEHRLCFERNVRAENVQLYPRALGAKQGAVSMKTGPSSSGDTWVNGEGNIPMDVLDEYGFEDVDFIKLDCEGYELFVLQGAEQLLTKWKPTVVVEQKPGMAKKFGLPEHGAVEFLESLGAKRRKEMAGDFFLSW